MKIILLVRNPFAVALSKYKKKNWVWVTDPFGLYNQDELRNDYLLQHEGLFRYVGKRDDFILNQVLIWSIIHYIPFHQFNSDEILVLFYEEIFKDPQQAMSKLSKFIGKQFDQIPEEIITRPSKVVGTNFLKGRSPIDSWMSDLPKTSIDRGRAILHEFGLDNIYDSTSMPNSIDVNKF